MKLDKQDLTAVGRKPLVVPVQFAKVVATVAAFGAFFGLAESIYTGTPIPLAFTMR